MNAEYYLSLPVQLKDILKEKRRGKVTKAVLFLHEDAPAHRALANHKKTGLPGLSVPCPSTGFSESSPVGLPSVPWTEIQLNGLCRGDLFERTTF
jgi:hypothetical protein